MLHLFAVKTGRGVYLKGDWSLLSCYSAGVAGVRRGVRQRMDNMTGNTPNLGKLRIIQESVPGKEITLAHIIASPDGIIYQKLGLDPNVDYHQAAIAVMALCPCETAVIAGDIALKTSKIEMGFLDRFSGTLIFTGRIGNVEASVQAILRYMESKLGFTVCGITRT